MKHVGAPQEVAGSRPLLSMFLSRLKQCSGMSTVMLKSLGLAPLADEWIRPVQSHPDYQVSGSEAFFQKPLRHPASELFGV